MKLLTAVTHRLSLLAALVLAFWAVFFYFALIDEVNDEVDDSLEDYADIIMVRALSGEPLPSASIGSNNQYFLHEVSAEYATRQPHVRYEDRSVYIKEKKEREPARVLTQIYQAEDGHWMELEVSTPTFEKDDLREAIFFWLLFLYVVLLLAIASTNVWVVWREMRPLHRLLAWLDAYRPGREAKPLDNPTKITEFRRLNQVAEEAICRSEELHRQQKLFIGNASHEMQTPLAVCTGRLEMLLEEGGGLTEEQMGEVLKVRRTLGNLSRLNRSLLLLCKIEGGQFPDTKQIDFNALLSGFLPDYETIYAHRHIRTQVEERGTFRMEMDESLASTLLSNLLKNAYTHNVEEGTVSITLTERALCIRNTGTPEPLDSTLIFTRFYHTPGKAASTGLGLSIALAIAQLYGLRLTYRHEDGLHAFELAR